MTGNTESLYSFFVLDLKADGPTVVEVPPGVMGPIDDHNFLFLADVGPTGQDKGKGGKYLILPPDYEGDVPDGYFVVRSSTNMVFSFLRANADVVGFGDKALKFYRDNAKVYPLKSGPREPRVKDITGVPFNTLVPENAAAFKWMHEIINYEPAEAFGKELLGKLASVGIEKGKPFKPDARMQQIFATAAEEGLAMSRVIAFDSRDENAKVYPGRQWESPYITNNSTFYQNDYINLGARTAFHFTADGITPAMAAQMPEGKGSRYQTAYKDSEGRPLDGNKTYKLISCQRFRLHCSGLSQSTIPGPAVRYRASHTQASAVSRTRRRKSMTTVPSTFISQMKSQRGLRIRTGSRPYLTRGSSCTSVTTAHSMPSTRKPGFRMMSSWWSSVYFCCHAALKGRARIAQGNGNALGRT